MFLFLAFYGYCFSEYTIVQINDSEFPLDKLFFTVLLNFSDSAWYNPIVSTSRVCPLPPHWFSLRPPTED